jgi:DNA-binding MarR family transcriptional regulator
MAETKISNEKRMLTLFKRLQKLGLNRCPNFENIISPAQMALLEQINRYPGCGVGDIANELKLSAPTVSVGVAKLEERGLVERKQDPEDRRSVQFFMTDSGQDLHKEFNQARLEKFHRLLSGLKQQDQISLLNLLEQALHSAERDEDSACDDGKT